jgi:hypothetical protein
MRAAGPVSVSRSSSSGSWTTTCPGSLVLAVGADSGLADGELDAGDAGVEEGASDRSEGRGGELGGGDQEHGAAAVAGQGGLEGAGDLGGAALAVHELRAAEVDVDGAIVDADDRQQGVAAGGALDDGGERPGGVAWGREGLWTAAARAVSAALATRTVALQRGSLASCVARGEHEGEQLVGGGQRGLGVHGAVVEPGGEAVLADIQGVHGDVAAALLRGRDGALQAAVDVVVEAPAGVVGGAWVAAGGDVAVGGEADREVVGAADEPEIGAEEGDDAADEGAGVVAERAAVEDDGLAEDAGAGVAGRVLAAGAEGAAERLPQLLARAGVVGEASGVEEVEQDVDAGDSLAGRAALSRGDRPRHACVPGVPGDRGARVGGGWGARGRTAGDGRGGEHGRGAAEGEAWSSWARCARCERA